MLPTRKVMRKLIHGTRGIYVNVSCEFSFEDGTICELPQDENGRVTISLYGEDHTTSKQWFMLMAMFEIDDPEYKTRVSFIQTPFIKDERIAYRVNHHYPKWYDKERKLCYAPGWPYVAVDDHGLCVDTRTDEVYKVSGLDKYPNIRAYDPLLGKNRQIAVHILVASAWVYRSRDGVHNCVNHLDGDKTNNFYRNLEWVTVAQNNEHAILNGLHPSPSPCRVRDIISGKVIKFASATRAAEFLGIKREFCLVSKQASVRVNRLYKGQYELRVEGDDRPWFYPKSDKKIHNPASRFIFTVVDNDKTKILHGIKELAVYFNLDYRRGAAGLVEDIKHYHPNVEISVNDQYTKDVIEVMDIATGAIKEYHSMTAVSKDLGIHPSVVRYCVRSSGSKVSDGYRMRYRNSGVWNDIVDNSVYIAKPIEVTHKDTNEVHIYSSLTVAASALGMERKSVKRHLLRPRKSDMYIMKLVDESSPVT